MLVTPQGCLPLVLMFDIKEDVDVEPQCITALMEQLDVFISIKPKPKQPSKVGQQAVWKLSEGISGTCGISVADRLRVSSRQTDWISVQAEVTLAQAGDTSGFKMSSQLEHLFVKFCAKMIQSSLGRK